MLKHLLFSQILPAERPAEATCTPCGTCPRQRRQAGPRWAPRRPPDLAFVLNAFQAASSTGRKSAIGCARRVRRMAT
jgi:hypothetical protein